MLYYIVRIPLLTLVTILVGTYSIEAGLESRTLMKNEKHVLLLIGKAALEGTEDFSMKDATKLAEGVRKISTPTPIIFDTPLRGAHSHNLTTAFMNDSLKNPSPSYLLIGDDECSVTTHRIRKLFEVVKKVPDTIAIAKRIRSIGLPSKSSSSSESQDTLSIDQNVAQEISTLLQSFKDESLPVVTGEEYCAYLDQAYETIKRVLIAHPNLTFLQGDLDIYGKARKQCREHLSHAHLPTNVLEILERIFRNYGSKLFDKDEHDLSPYDRLHTLFIRVLDKKFAYVVLLNSIIESLGKHRHAIVFADSHWERDYPGNGIKELALALRMKIVEKEDMVMGKVSFIEQMENPGKYLNLFLDGTLQTIDTFGQLTHQTKTLPLEKCTVCPKLTTNRCSQCKKSYYCSRACQQNDWAHHSSSCQKQV